MAPRAKPQTKPAAPRLTRQVQQWAKVAEDSAPAVELRLLADARTAYALLPLGSQLRLAEEIAEARNHEFVRAYANVVALSAGIKRQRTRRGVDKLNGKPCVIFMVRRKWLKSDLGQARQMLPRELLVHADVQGSRRLCAVPADVQVVDALAGARAHSNTSVAVTEKVGVNQLDAQGTLAWPIRVGSQGPFVVAPLHVLSPLSVLSPLPTMASGGRRTASRVATRNAVGSPLAAPPALQTLEWGGRLVPLGSLSFDVQLASVQRPDLVRNALAGLRFSKTRPMATSTSEVAELSASAGLFILVPDNHPDTSGGARGRLRADYSASPGAQIPLRYPVAGGPDFFWVSHALVMELELRFGNRTIAGDSGAAVVSPAADGDTLVGMHIAGDMETSRSWVLPAWQMFNRAFYRKLPEGEITLTSL